MEYNSETPFSRKINVEHEKQTPSKWSSPEEFSEIRQIAFSLKRDYNLMDAINEPEPPTEDITSSYCNQMIRLQLNGREYLLAGLEQDLTNWPNPISARDPLRAELLGQMHGYWISAWHPLGYPTPINALAERDLALQAAIDHLRTFIPELRVIPATAVQTRGSWVEGGAILAGIPETVAIAAARKLGQQAIVEITSERLRVIPVDAKVHQTGDQIQILELDAAPCPMLRGCETERPCKRYGGPYGSRAIAAASYWSSQRAVAISRLGCSLCEAGNTPFPHGSLDSNVMNANASRHGTATRVDPDLVARFNGIATISPLEKAMDGTE